MSSYSLEDYLWLLDDRVRLEAYARAVEKVVKPGDVVVDIGSGVGTFSVMAALAGASKVYAVDDNPHGELVRRLAAGNGVASRVEWLEGLSHDVEVPERVDVALFDDFNLWRLSTVTRGIVDDLRARWLKPEGAILPDSIELFVAPVSHTRARGWKKRKRVEGARIDLDLSPFRPIVQGTVKAGRLPASALMAPPRRIVKTRLVDLAETSLGGRGAFTLERSGKVDGLLVYFALRLCRGVGFDTGPLGGGTAYHQLFLPASRSMKMREGERLHFEARGDIPDASGVDAIWSWALGPKGDLAEGSSVGGASLDALTALL